MNWSDASDRMMTIPIALTVLVAAVAVVVVAGARLNQRVIAELEAQPDGERARRVMVITFPDGTRVPVNYLREGDTVFAGSDFGWWRRIENEGTTLRLLIQGETLDGTARVSNDEEYTYQVFERLRPDAPTWASRLVNAKLVEISLNQP